MQGNSIREDIVVVRKFYDNDDHQKEMIGNIIKSWKITKAHRKNKAIIFVATLERENILISSFFID